MMNATCGIDLSQQVCVTGLGFCPAGMPDSGLLLPTFT